MPNAPDTPGKDLELIKPGIPKPAWEDEGGGDNTFWVTFTRVAGSEDNYDPDKTYEEVGAAIDAGQIVMAKVVESEISTIILSCVGYTEDEIAHLAAFGGSISVGEQGTIIYSIFLLKGQIPGGDFHSTLNIKNIS